MLEYCGIGSLGAVLRKDLDTGLKENVIAAISYQLLLALSNLDKKGILHRDLKVCEKPLLLTGIN